MSLTTIIPNLLDDVIISGSLSVQQNVYFGGNVSIYGNIQQMGSPSTIPTKYYMYSGTISSSTVGSVSLVLATGTSESYYIKVSAILNESSNNNNISVLTFEACGRTTSSIAIWNINESHPPNSYPWSSSVTGTGGSTTHTISFHPFVQHFNNYTYQIKVELMTNDNAVLNSIVQDGTAVATFNY
jgi:hypothetical protein